MNPRGFKKKITLASLNALAFLGFPRGTNPFLRKTFISSSKESDMYAI